MDETVERAPGCGLLLLVLGALGALGGGSEERPSRAGASAAAPA
jgi:hypothetical protein